MSTWQTVIIGVGAGVGLSLFWQWVGWRRAQAQHERENLMEINLRDWIIGTLALPSNITDRGIRNAVRTLRLAANRPCHRRHVTDDEEPPLPSFMRED